MATDPQDPKLPDDACVLQVHGWHTQCGVCGYGGGGWAGGPARGGKPILTPSSRTCDGCGVAFTHVLVVPTDVLTTIARLPGDAAVEVGTHGHDL